MCDCFACTSILLFVSFIAILVNHQGKAFMPYWLMPCHYLSECCYDPWSYPADITGLAEQLDSQLFGQHLAKDTILGAIDGHVKNPNPAKPLVLSLHGPTGTGKNHISQLIVNSLFRYNMESHFVELKISTKDYPHKENVQNYKQELFNLIHSKVYSCPHQVFIFDEVENMPPGLLDSIKVLLDYHQVIDGINYRHAIFIFLSNLAATKINQHVWNVYESSTRRREDITLLEMEKLIMREVFEHEDAGLYRARIIDSHLVSHFVPFLPLEVSHIRLCIRKEIKRNGVNPTVEMEEQVLDSLQFNGPKGSRVFALKGCKNVEEKVNVMLYKLRRLHGHKDHKEL